MTEPAWQYLKGGDGLNFVDSVIAMVSPRKGYERAVWQKELDYVRSHGYDAAMYGRANAGWRAFNESAEMTDRHSRDIVRARARDLERNSDIACSVIHAYKRNTVGKGFSLQAKTGNPDLNKEMEKLWNRWTKAKNCDITGEQSFNQLLRMAVERKKVDGGMLFVFRYTNDGLVPLKIQTLEVDELDINITTPKKKGNRVIGGVEYDKNRKPVGYWFSEYDIEGWRVKDPVYIDAKYVYFYKAKRRPSQLREISDMTQTITRIRDINEFINAVAVKERIAACLSVFIKRALPANGTLGRGAQTDGPRVEYEGKSLAPGMIKEMGVGDDIQVVDPKGAGSDAAALLKLQQGLIGAGQGLSYEAVSRDMAGSTYSSARQNAIEDEVAYTEDVELLKDFMREVYENFFISCWLKGLISVPDFWEKKDDYLEHMWVKAPKPWIDPVKEASANKTALQSCQKTLPDICAERGKDWKDAIDEMAAVNDYAKEKGVEIGGVIYGTT